MTWLPSKTIKVKSRYGKIHITLVEGNGRPPMVFIDAGKVGTGLQALVKGAQELINLALEKGATLEEVVQAVLPYKVRPEYERDLWEAIAVGLCGGEKALLEKEVKHG